MMKTSSLTAASLLVTTVAGVLLSSCTPPTPPPPPPGRGRSLDAPPRYGVPEQQTRYFEGATMDPGAVQPPNPDAPLTSPDSLTPPPPGSTPGTPPPVTVTPPGPTPPTSPISPAAPPSSTPPPAPAPAPADYPVAIRIPGKPGFVKSPFDPSGQAIDVRDFASGQKAKCPYTGKIFRVP